MTTTTLRSVKGYRIRITALTECGDPAISEGCGTVVSDGFIRCSISTEFDSGQQFLARDIFGRLCISDRDPDQLLRSPVEIELCEINPDVLVLMTGDQPLLSSGEAYGTVFSSTRNFSAFGLEIWTRALGSSCAGRWGYFALPFVRNGRIDGGLSIDRSAMTVTIRGEAAPAPASWGTGPYGDDPLGQAFPAGGIFAQAVTSAAPPALEDLALCPDRLLEGGVFWIDAELSATL